MEREVQHKVNGDRYAVLSPDRRGRCGQHVLPHPLGSSLSEERGRGVTCALALLQDLDHQLGRRFLDVLVGDALYLQAPFVQEVERLGLIWAFTLKENQPDLWREAV